MYLGNHCTLDLASPDPAFNGNFVSYDRYVIAPEIPGQIVSGPDVDI